VHRNKDGRGMTGGDKRKKVGLCIFGFENGKAMITEKGSKGRKKDDGIGN